MPWDRGRGGGYLSLLVTSSDPERAIFTNPAQPRRIQKKVKYILYIYIYIYTAVTPQGKKRHLCMVLSRLSWSRYGKIISPLLKLAPLSFFTKLMCNFGLKLCRTQREGGGCVSRCCVKTGCDEWQGQLSKGVYACVCVRVCVCLRMCCACVCVFICLS